MEIKKHILTRSECYLPLITPRDDGKNIPTHITIHETSIRTEKAPANRTAEHYINLLDHPAEGADPRCAYHFLCGDDEVWQFLPTWTRTAHTGNTEGNSSLGIERLVNVNIDFDKAIHNQSKLTATLMDMYNIPIQNVVPHKHWSGKECPARLLAGLYGWTWNLFIAHVSELFHSKDFFEGIDVF